MKKIGIIPNLKKDANLEVTKEVVDFILNQGFTPLLTEQTADLLFYKHLAVPFTDIYKMSDFIVTLGGDGTLLSAAKNAAIYGVPLMGVNLGTLGFLTDVEKKDATSCISSVINGRYKLEQRLMLEANILTQPPTTEPLIALNDICFLRGSFSRIIHMVLFVNNEFVDSYEADGLIISTPTGSTAYNLSAGGPLLTPTSSLIAVTPVCPHNLHTRSWVFTSDDEITVKLPQNHRSDIFLSYDSNRVKLSDGDEIKISRSKLYTKIIKTNNIPHYDILRQKIVRKGVMPDESN